jgi:hypothetical protein
MEANVCLQYLRILRHQAGSMSSSKVTLSEGEIRPDHLMVEQARRFAHRVLEEAGSVPADQADRAFRLALGRKATDRELDWSLDFLRKQAQAYAQHVPLSAQQDGSGSDAVGTDPGANTDTAAFRALADLCHAMFNLNEFLYLE